MRPDGRQAGDTPTHINYRGGYKTVPPVDAHQLFCSGILIRLQNIWRNCYCCRPERTSLTLAMLVQEGVRTLDVYNNNKIYLFTAIGLSPGGSGYFTCKQNMKLVTTKFKSGGLHEKYVVATWNVGNRLSVCL